MRDRTVNRVESWDARPFSGGFGTLRELSDGSFSGVVVSGDAWLFMLNGRIVGIVDGDIDDFDDTSGTMYEAPDPALPLLFSMQERGGSTQAKYYTNDTPLQEANKTLSDANFTGYVELSENVLSGDYYLVYYGGRMLPVAFVGTTEELKSGDEAYELASDEVGVYEVIKTPVNVTQVPGPAGGDADDAGGAATAENDEHGATAAGAGGASAAGADAGTAGAGAAGTSGTIDDEDSTDEPESAKDDSSPVEAAEPDTTAVSESAGEPEPAVDSSSEQDEQSTADDAIETPESSAGPDSPNRDERPDGRSTTGSTPVESTDPSPGSNDTDAAADGAVAEDAEGDGGPDSSVFSEEEQWRQTKSIPSLSPSEREKRRRTRAERASGDASERTRQSSERTRQSSERTRQSSTGSDSPGPKDQARTKATEASTTATSATSSADEPEPQAQSSSAQKTGASNNSSGVSESEMREYRDRIEELQGRLEQLDAEKTDVEADLESVRDERDDLQRRVRQLESALEEAGGEPTSGPALTPDEALDGTNLFVRYGSKGQPTLDELTGKNPDKEAINTNLRIDHHTQFESGDASVDGAPFSQFLESSSSYRFVSWLVRELPYEILDSGRRSGLVDFYDVVPDIDRAELQGVVEVETESGNERREFDIVLRDRMGNPLVVADLNDERDPVTGEEMEALVDAATVVGEGADDLGAAFYVTASFFEPDALENAGAATANGGILSRSDRMSYVKLGRKRGFHLCLTEDRNETFHLTVPEL